MIDLDANALTILYLKTQELKDLTPTEFVEKYIKVNREISEAIKQFGVY